MYIYIDIYVYVCVYIYIYIYIHVEALVERDAGENAAMMARSGPLNMIQHNSSMIIY